MRNLISWLGRQVDRMLWSTIYVPTGTSAIYFDWLVQGMSEAKANDTMDRLCGPTDYAEKAVALEAHYQSCLESWQQMQVRDKARNAHAGLC